MADPTPIKYSDLVKDDGAITDLIQQLKDLIDAYDAAAKRVQSAASDMAKSLNTVSGATEEQRNAIALVSKEADKLEQEYRDAYSAQMEAKKASLELAAAKKEESQVTKLLQQLNVSAEGSYNRLSAQYRLLKIRINEMGEADANAVKQKRAMEKEAQALYARMNDLQKATGKYTLQVGNYERALGGALGVNSQFIEALQDTGKAGEMVKGTMAAMVSPIGLVTVAIGAAIGAIKLFADSVHTTQQTGDAFDYAMAEWNGTWAVFQKAVSTFDFSNFIQGARNAAAAMRELAMARDEAFEIRGSIAVQKAMIADEQALRQQRMRNQKLSYEERKEAADEYLKAMKPIYDQQIELETDLYEKELNYIFEATNKRKGLNKEQTESAKRELANLLDLYGARQNEIKAAREYLQAEEDVAAAIKLSQQATGATSEIYQNQIQQGREIIATASEETKALAESLKMHGLTSNAELGDYYKQREAMLRAMSAYNEENTRVITLINRMDSKQTKTATDNSKKRTQVIKDEAEEQGKIARAQADAYQKKMDDMIAATEKAYLDQLDTEITILDYQIAATDEKTTEMLNLRLAKLEVEREKELELNSRKAEEMRIDEALINAKYDKMREREAEKFGKETAKAVEDGVKEAKKKGGYSSIWEMIFPKEEQEGVREAVAQVTAQVIELAQQMIGLWTEAADKAVQSADKQVESAQRVVDAEREAAANGYANRAKAAEKDLALAKKNQEKALKEQERAQKVQLALNSVLEASQMVVASANIWSTFSGMGPAGPAIAIAMLALMWGSFLASKAKAMAETGTEKYAEGTVELLQGGSHASGHDISLGRKADGTERRAEGGEFFAVINKRNSRRYRNIIPEVIDSFNDGTFAEKYQRANGAMAGYAVEMIGGGTDLSRLEKGVDAIQRQGETRRTVEGDMIVIRYKNLTQKIKN